MKNVQTFLCFLIIGMYSMINSQSVVAQVNGKNVMSVTTTNNLTFTSVGDKKWAEIDADGKPAFYFNETNRDEWSVYLQQVDYAPKKLAIDLWQKKVKINGSPLYDISSSSVQRSGSKTNNTIINNSGSNVGSETNEKPEAELIVDGTPVRVKIKNCSEQDMTLYCKSSDGEREIKLLVAGSGETPDSYWEGDSRLGDIFSFKVAANGFYSRNFVVVEDNMEHCALAKELYGKALGTKRISNAAASRHGYDLLKLDPIYIIYGKDDWIKDNKGNKVDVGGQRAQIFDDLDRGDYDWSQFDGNIALKNHFFGKDIPGGRGNFSRKMYSSKTGFKQGITANIEVSGGVSKGKDGADGQVKATRSASFNHTYNKDENNKSVYIINSKAHEWYTISLVPEHIDFTRDFVKDVVDLYQADETAYTNFIEKYGTHFPTKTVYGAKFMSTERFSHDELSEATSWGVDVGATVSGSVPVPKDPTTTVNGEAQGKIGYSRSESYTAMEQDNTKMYQYVGGAKGEGDWNVSADTAVPIDITLNRISELINRAYFPYYPSVDFTQVKNKLAKAITKYLGSPTDSGVSKKPRLFRIADVKVKNVEWFNEHQLYGHFGIGTDGTVSNNLFWYVKDNMHYNDTDKFLKTGKHDRAVVNMPHRIDDELKDTGFVFSLEEGQNTISIGGSLYRWHFAGNTDGLNEEGDRIGSVIKQVDLSSNASKTVTLRYDEHHGKGDVIVTIEPVLFTWAD